MKLVLGKECENKVVFVEEQDKKAVNQFFRGEYLEKDLQVQKQGAVYTLFVGMGKKKNDRLAIREACAAAVQAMQERKITEYCMDVTLFMEAGAERIWDVAEGAYLGTYQAPHYKTKSDAETNSIVSIFDTAGVLERNKKEAEQILEEAVTVSKSVCFARDMVNLPGNRLRPEDFAKQMQTFGEAAGVEVELIQAGNLRQMGMQALLAVGDSSEFPPYLAVLRYHGNKDSAESLGLIGKGVTCDTGGYCLKPADSMLGIKGDMAGGAAVVGAITALAKNQIKTNVVAVVPICENRISPGSLLPGDVIESYGKKTIEIVNTDAEGRLILADAMSYMVRNEKVTKVLDIATLTGAVVGL